MRRLLSLWIGSLCFAIGSAARDGPKPNADRSPVAATIETTLDTAARQIRQFAFDGDAVTYFRSAHEPGMADHFTLIFDEPVAVKWVSVTTGRPDGSEGLEAGRVETSSDGKTFRDRAHFSNGTAYAVPGGTPIRAIRIKPAQQLPHPLAIRELTIESEPPVARFQFPVEFIVDVADAPDMKNWAEKAARVCERWYPMINEELKSDGYKPPRVVTMALEKSYRGVAEAGGSRIVGSARYFKDHADDIGAMVHETTHIVQRYRGGNTPGWLVEGISDYVRFFKYEPGQLGQIDRRRAHYNGSYRVSAAFLAYVADQYDKQLVRKLNAILRAGKYSDEAFKQLTGKTVQELDDEWRAKLRE